MSHEINIFLLLFGALQGGLLSAWLLWNERRRISNIYLSLFLIVVGLQLTFKVITKTWVMHYAFIPYIISYKLPYLIGPLIYLFTRSQQEKKWQLTDLIHAIPFLLFSITAARWYGLIYHEYVQATLQLISLGIYTWLAIRLSKNGVKQFVILVAGAECIIIIALAVMHVYYPRFAEVRLLFIVLSLLMYWISYKLLSRSPFIFQPQAAVLNLRPQKNVKYAHSSLKEQEADRIEKALHVVMIEQKYYTDITLTIDMLAASVNASRHHVSQVINERMHKTYADYVCDLRLQEARMRLIDPSNSRFTIAGIAMDAGFNAVSTFNDAFRRRYNTTPSRYRDQVLKEQSA